MYYPGMRVLLVAVAITILSAGGAAAADPLAEARRLYNLGEYDAAVRYAREALELPAVREGARLVLGRIHLERYRRTADQADLSQARDALKSVNPASLDNRERAELTIGLGESLFYEDRFGIAAETFERALDSSAVLGPAAHERLLDWWATSIDRLALSRAREDRKPVYWRIVTRMERELAGDPASAPAAYWLAAGLRGSGHLERAWHAAAAGWITAVLGRDRGAALRADLDRLVTQVIIPERAVRLQPRDPQPAAAVMLVEWDALKMLWSR